MAAAGVEAAEVLAEAAGMANADRAADGVVAAVTAAVVTAAAADAVLNRNRAKHG